MNALMQILRALRKLILRKGITMHTSAYESCRIHHNGAYDGDIFITNKDSTSTPIEKKAEIRYTSEGLITRFRMHKKMSSQSRTIIIESNTGGDDPEIEILFTDIQSYVEDVLIDKVKEKFDEECSFEDLEKIADILNIEY